MTLRLTPSPGVVVLAGRLVAQTGLFVYTIGPIFVLDDTSYNDLLVGITVMMLTVGGPVRAFQQHLIRYDVAVTSLIDARRKSILLALALAIAGSVVTMLITTLGAETLLLAMGTVLSVVPSITASLHALAGRFVHSALIDATSGFLLMLLTVLLIGIDAQLSTWAVAFMMAWLVSAMVAAIGPLAPPRGSVPSVFGNFWHVLGEARTMIAIGFVSIAFSRADYLVLAVVGTEPEAARYAIATRVVGPVLIALGSLNNSLYVRQINLRDHRAAFIQLTRRASRKVGWLAVVVVPVALLVVIAMGDVSATFASRSLLPPALLLAVATIPYAFAIPYGFALNAQGRERVWLLILSVATVVDLIAVWLVGHRGATLTAALWLGTQFLVWVTVARVWRPAR